MTKLRLTVLLFISCTYTAGTTANEAIYPLVTYKCNQEADIIALTNSILKGKAGTSYKYSDEDGTYSPWDLVEIDRRNERTRIERPKKIVKKFKLITGEYTITLEPQVISKNLSLTCVTSISSPNNVSFDEMASQ